MGKHIRRKTVPGPVKPDQSQKDRKESNFSRAVGGPSRSGIDEFRSNGTDLDLDWGSDCAGMQPTRTLKPSVAPAITTQTSPQPIDISELASGFFNLHLSATASHATTGQDFSRLNPTGLSLKPQYPIPANRGTPTSVYNENQAAAEQRSELDRVNALLQQLPENINIRDLVLLKQKRNTVQDGCCFCKNNGEDYTYYSKHILKDRRGRVLCPVLRAYHCPRCGISGDHAHTIKFCPLSTPADHETSIAVLKKSARKSSGRIRR